MLPSSISRSYADSPDVFCYEGDVRDKDGPLHSVIPVLSDLSVIPIFPVSYVFSALIRSTRGFNSRLFSVLYEVCFSGIFLREPVKNYLADLFPPRG